MGRTFDDDLDDDAPGGGLDLEKGSAVGSGASSSYEGGGLDFDDDDAPAGGALELDLPKGQGASGAGLSAPPQAVPDLALPPPAPSSGSLRPNVAVSARPNAPMPARSSGPQMPPAVPPAPASSSGAHSIPSGPSGASGPSAPPSAPGAVSQHAPQPVPPAPPSRPNAAAIVAKFPEPPAQVWQTPKYAMLVLMRQFELRSDLESLRRRRSPDVPLYEAALKAYDTKTFRLGMVLACSGLAIATILFFMPVILRFVRAD